MTAAETLIEHLSTGQETTLYAQLDKAGKLLKIPSFFSHKMQARCP